MRPTNSLTAVPPGAAADAGERVYLWPEGAMPDKQRHQIAAMTDEARQPGFDPAAHSAPYIEWCPPPAADKKNDVCMILISGGGYHNCCDVGLVKMWRERFTDLGCQCVNLVYRTPRPKGLPYYQSAWEDGQRAVRLVRAEAAKRGFDPEKIGTVSMSAGSHLATLLATSSATPAYPPRDELDQTPCHVNWAIAGAIAYGLTDGAGVPNTRDGDAPDVRLAPEFKFDAKTAPMCMLHGGADTCSPNAATQVYRQLRRMKIPAEVHVYPDKGHGFYGLERGVEFMRQMGWLGQLAPEEDINQRFTGDAARGAFEKEEIWPEGKIPDFQEKQCVPYIEWHLPKELKTEAIQIIYSGGAYDGNNFDWDGVSAARRYLNAKGMTVVTLCYRVPRPQGLQKHVTAWQDLQRAVRLVRAKAAAKGLDPARIGLMGGSAGGHLALMGALSSRHRSYWPLEDMDTTPCNVQWAVALYPAYILTDGADDANAHGGNEDDDRLVPELSFDLDSCPVLFIHGDADTLAAMNSVKCWEQLRRMGIQGELHTLAKRGHCFMMSAAPGTGSYTWLDRVWEFLSEKKFNQ